MYLGPTKPESWRAGEPKSRRAGEPGVEWTGESARGGCSQGADSRVNFVCIGRACPVGHGAAAS